MSDDPRQAAADQKAQAAADKARAKAMRPWYKKKRFLMPIALIVIVLLAIVSSGGEDATSPGGDQANGQADQSDGGAQVLFAGRPDAQPNDQERNLGEAASINDVDAVVTQGQFQQQINDFEDDGYLVISVNLQNTGDRARPYNTFNWRIQTPGGQVLDPCFCGDQLDSGDIVQGGSVSGNVIFEVGDERGDFFILWKPDIKPDRGIWKVTV